jgi:hypothetical protein
MIGLAAVIFMGGVFGARGAGARWLDAFTCPSNLGYALGHWAWRNGGDL